MGDKENTGGFAPKRLCAESVTFLDRMVQEEEQVWGEDEASSCENADFEILMNCKYKMITAVILSVFTMWQVLG